MMPEPIASSAGCEAVPSGPVVTEAFRNSAQAEHRFTHCRVPLIEGRGPPTLVPVSGSTDTPGWPPAPTAAAAHSAVP